MLIGVDENYVGLSTHRIELDSEFEFEIDPSGRFMLRKNNDREKGGYDQTQNRKPYFHFRIFVAKEPQLEAPLMKTVVKPHHAASLFPIIFFTARRPSISLMS